MIGKVWKQKANNVKLVTISQKSDIKEGDYVDYIKVKFKKVKENGKKK